LRRHIDLVFRTVRIAVEVRGCFWHHCPQHGVIPKANGEWWREKLAHTRARDEDTAYRLRVEGWTLFTVWEHEDVVAAADRIAAAVVEARRKLRDCPQDRRCKFKLVGLPDRDQT
jgi:DNA mismatch endonuclease (patch repair protein)